MLDIEVAASLAPGAKIVVYFAPFTEQGWVDVISTAVHDTQNHPTVLSISWGYTEGQDIWTSQAIQAVNQAFQAAGVLGVTICCASGDDGSADQLADGKVHVDFPAASPYVLACGGTSLQFSGTGQFDVTGETVWNNGNRQSGGGATGGGISELNALPSWQQGIVPPSANPSHTVGRGVPDVAGNADEQSGYTILVDGQTLNGVGGTSAVSPLWAALIARINQQLGKPVGYITPLLYSQLGRAGGFHDVTTGNNDPTGGSLGGYSANAGWDACTGWGSPRRHGAVARGDLRRQQRRRERHGHDVGSASPCDRGLGRQRHPPGGDRGRHRPAAPRRRDSRSAPRPWRASRRHVGRTRAVSG